MAEKGCLEQPLQQELHWESRRLGRWNTICVLLREVPSHKQDGGERSGGSTGEAKMSHCPRAVPFCSGEIEGAGEGQRHLEAVGNTREWGLGRDG